MEDSATLRHFELDYSEFFSGVTTVATNEDFALVVNLQTLSSIAYDELFFATADFFNTGTFDLGTSTSGATLVALSSVNAAVPLPAAAWLFVSGLLGLIGIARCKKAA